MDISGVWSIHRQLIGPQESYTPEEKRRVLNRHTVTNISTQKHMVMRAFGSLVGGTLAGAAGSGADFSRMRVAASRAGTAFVLGTVASAKQKTPLENARAELIQTEEDRLLIKTATSATFVVMI